MTFVDMAFMVNDASFEVIGQQALLLGKNGLDVANASSIASLRG